MIVNSNHSGKTLSISPTLRGQGILAEDVEIKSLIEPILILLSQTQVPALLLDQQGVIILLNRPFQLLTGYRYKEILNRKFRDFESDVVDIVEIEKRKRKLEKENGHYHGHIILKNSRHQEVFCGMSTDKFISGKDEYYLYQINPLEQSNIQNYKDLVAIRNLINNGMFEIKDVSDVVKRININYRRMLFVMKQFEGTTPKQYLKGVKLKRGIDMLKRGLTYKEVAFDLGFWDVSHLCNTFREEMKMTISEYMQKNK